MRLLLCSENYPPSVGGVQEVMRQVAERLAARGHRVTVFTGAYPARAARAVIRGVEVVSFRASGNLVRGFRGEIDRYREAVLGGAWDAVLVKAAQQWTFDALTPVLGRLQARKVFIPCGFSGLHDRSYREYYRRMPGWLREFDALVFYASAYRDIDLARAHGLTNLHVVPNGVDEREFGPEAADAGARAELGVPAGDLLLLSVGTRVLGKGHWEVVSAFDRARLPGPATLVINGNDPYRGAAGRVRRLLALAHGRRLPLEWEAAAVGRRHRGRKRVLVVDLPRAALIRTYRAADLFVLASHVEYSPLVLFEAAAAGTPFLSSPVGNASEIARWTGGGWVYDAPLDATGRARVDPSALARELERRVADRGALAAAGAAARERVVRGGFTWEAIVPRYEALLSGARGEGAVPAPSAS